jgi:hypothetical protein
LRKAFSNIAAASPSGLESLSLDFGVYRDNVKSFERLCKSPNTPREMIDDAAQHVLKLTMTALQGSSLQVKSLRLFHHNDDSHDSPCSLGCGISILRFRMIEWDALPQWPATLSRLSINIWNYFPEQGLWGQDVGLGRDRGFSDLLRACPNLEALNTSVNSSRKGRWQSHSLTSGPFWWEQIQQLLRSKLPHLRDLRLEGFAFESRDLIRFLRSNGKTIWSFTLQRMAIWGQPFPIFAKILANEFPSLTDIRVQNVIECLHGISHGRVERQVSFDGVGELQSYVETNGDQRQFRDRILFRFRVSMKTEASTRRGP